MQLFSALSTISEFSGLFQKNAELLRKKQQLYPGLKEEAPITREKTYRESLKENPYFDTPLLQEVLEEKLEEQILVEPTENVDDVLSKINIHEQGEEFFEFLVQTLRNISTREEQIKDQLEKQRDSIYDLIERKVNLFNLRYERASKEVINKPTLPEKFKEKKDMAQYIKVAAKQLIEEQFDQKISEVTEKFTKDSQDFSTKIQEFKDNLAQTQDSEKFQNLIQEIALVQKEASTELKKKLSYQLEPQTVLVNLDHELTELSEGFQRFLKPIKTGLKGGERLATNGHLTSENGIFNLVNQYDGNLVLYKFSDAIWSTGTYGRSKNPELYLDPKDGILKMQQGNYTANSVNPKNSNYYGQAYLKISNQGTFEIGGSGVTKPWTPKQLKPASNTLVFFDKLGPRSILVSENKIYTLALLDDYNLVLYEGANPIWHSGNSYPGLKDKHELSLTNQGALVLRNSAGTSEFVVIPPHPTFKGRVSLLVTNDGKITINNGSNQELWNSQN